MPVLSWKHPDHVSRSRNVAIGAVATLVQSFLPFVFIPVFMKWLGPEAYGLVILNASILAALFFLDRVFSAVLTREFGVLNGGTGNGQRMRDMLRTFEIIVFGMAIIIAVGANLALPFFTGQWQASNDLQPADLSKAFVLMAVVLGAQWPGFLYSAGLVGLQRNTLLNGIRVGGMLIQSFGGVLVLLIVGPSVLVLLAWQAGVIIVISLVLRITLWRVMPTATLSPAVRLGILGDVWQMALGSLLIGACAAVITQLDKLLVAQIARPDQYTAYALTYMASAAAFGAFSAALSAAMQPYFASLLAKQDEADVAETYHRWAQVFGLCAIPTAGVLIAFPQPLIDLWLGANTVTGRQMVELMPVMALAGLLAVLLGPPAVLQAAAGWNSLVLFCHLLAITAVGLLLPGILRSHGPMGGAWFSVAVVAGYYAIMAPLMHRRLLKGSLLRWFGRDIAVPMIVGFCIFGAAIYLTPASAGLAMQSACAVLAAGLCFAALLAALPDGRRQCLASAAFLTGRLNRP